MSDSDAATFTVTVVPPEIIPAAHLDVCPAQEEPFAHPFATFQASINQKGSKDIKLEWTLNNGVETNILGYYILRTMNEDPDTEVRFLLDKEDSSIIFSDPTYSFIDNSTVEWSNSFGDPPVTNEYTYTIAAYYDSGESSSVKELDNGEINPGNKQCEGIIHVHPFCLGANGAKDGDLVKSYNCPNDDNNILTPLSECESGKVCVVIDDNGPEAQCWPKIDTCDSRGNPFGIFATKDSCEKENDNDIYCYYGSSETIVDECKSCTAIDDCTDYKSGEACTANHCRIGDASSGGLPHCAWQPTFGELGKGYCYDSGNEKLDTCYIPNIFDQIFFNLVELDNDVCKTFGDCYYDEANLGCKQSTPTDPFTITLHPEQKIISKDNKEIKLQVTGAVSNFKYCIDDGSGTSCTPGKSETKSNGEITITLSNEEFNALNNKVNAYYLRYTVTKGSGYVVFFADAKGPTITPSDPIPDINTKQVTLNITTTECAKCTITKLTDKTVTPNIDKTYADVLSDNAVENTFLTTDDYDAADVPEAFGYEFSITLESLYEGHSYDLNVKCKDKHGNEVTQTVEFDFFPRLRLYPPLPKNPNPPLDVFDSEYPLQGITEPGAAIFVQISNDGSQTNYPPPEGTILSMSYDSEDIKHVQQDDELKTLQELEVQILKDGYYLRLTGDWVTFFSGGTTRYLGIYDNEGFPFPYNTLQRYEIVSASYDDAMGVTGIELKDEIENFNCPSCTIYSSDMMYHEGMFTVVPTITLESGINWLLVKAVKEGNSNHVRGRIQYIPSDFTITLINPEDLVINNDDFTSAGNKIEIKIKTTENDNDVETNCKISHLNEDVVADTFENLDMFGDGTAEHSLTIGSGTTSCKPNGPYCLIGGTPEYPRTYHHYTINCTLKDHDDMPPVSEYFCFTVATWQKLGVNPATGVNICSACDYSGRTLTDCDGTTVEPSVVSPDVPPPAGSGNVGLS